MSLRVNDKAAQVEQLINYVFADKLIAAEAVQMAAPSVAVQMAAPSVAVLYESFRSLPNNKRLSILGDAILTKVLCSIWFSARDRHGRELSASDWTTFRNDMLSNDNLAQRGHDLGIDACVFCNEGTVVSAKMTASTLEAIIGAVYQDGGDEPVVRVIEHLGFTDHRLFVVTSHTFPYKR